MNEILKKIAEKRVQVGVIGLGYVGLPLAVEIATAGIQVVGIDLDRSKVERINAGTSYIPDVPPEAVEKHVKAKRLRAVCAPNGSTSGPPKINDQPCGALL